MDRVGRFVPPAPREMSRDEFERRLAGITQQVRYNTEPVDYHPPQTVHPEDTIDAIAASGNPPPRYGDINPPNSANREAEQAYNSIVGAYAGEGVSLNPSAHYVLHETGNACNLSEKPYNPWAEPNPCNETQPKSEEDINMSEQRQWLPEDFPFAGTTVALNPEKVSDIRAYEREYGDKLIVIDHRADDSTIDTILTMGDTHMPSWNVQCMFLRSGKRNSFSAKQLMIIDEPIVPIKMVQLSNGDTYFLNKELMPNEQEVLDKKVIVKGYRINYQHDWDVHFRNAKVAKAYEVLNEQAQREEARKSKKKRAVKDTDGQSTTRYEEVDLGAVFEGDDSEF